VAGTAIHTSIEPIAFTSPSRAANAHVIIFGNCQEQTGCGARISASKITAMIAVIMPAASNTPWMRFCGRYQRCS